MIEGLDYQFLQIVRRLESGLGVKPERIVAIGGAVNNSFWMQNKADVVGVPIEVPELDEAVPLGAALLAGIGTGVYKDEAEAFERVRQPARIYVPDPGATEKYATRFRTFEKLYPALKDLSAELRGLEAG
jgi:xylulokinase